MAYRLPAHLHRNRHGVLYFRLTVPNDIRHLPEQREIYRSLNTPNVRQAADAAQTLRIAFGAIFRELRATTMPDEEKAAPTVILKRLKEVTRFAKEKLQLQDRRDELLETLQDSIVQQRAERKQHARELDVAIRAKGGAVSIAKGLPFSEALKSYYEDAQIKATTKRTYRGRLDHAQAYFGVDKDVRHIEQADVSDYARHVKKTVADDVTQGHYIRTLATFLNFHRIRKGWGASLTTKTLLTKKLTPDSEDRDAFSLDQLSAIFDNVRKYKLKNPCKYWTTVATAFTGCRIEELAQIHIERDLRRDNDSGVWFIDLNGKRDPDGLARKSLKNPSSWRCVPIHSALVERGFIDFLHAQVKAGRTRPFESGWIPSLFDDGEGGKAHKWGHYISNWGGRELKKLRASGRIIDPENKLSYFHSMRHSVSGLMGSTGVPAEACEASMGHKYAGGERERYQKLKSDPVLLSKLAIEPGLIELVSLLT